MTHLIKNLLIKEDNLIILVTLSETAGFYKVCKKRGLGHFINQSDWFSGFFRDSEFSCIEEVSRVEKDILGGIRSVLK
jgi:hypothetical protein